MNIFRTGTILNHMVKYSDPIDLIFISNERPWISFDHIRELYFMIKVINSLLLPYHHFHDWEQPSLVKVKTSINIPCVHTYHELRTLMQKQRHISSSSPRISPWFSFPQHFFSRRFWFHFTVENTQKDQRVIFNVVNLCKARNLFTDGLTPVIKSTSRPRWQRMPTDHVFYYKSPLHRYPWLTTI